MMSNRRSHKIAEAKIFRAAANEIESPKGRERLFEIIATDVSRQMGFEALFPNEKKKSMVAFFRAASQKALARNAMRAGLPMAPVGKQALGFRTAAQVTSFAAS